MEIQEKVSMLAEDFAACSKILTAIGDETRQRVLYQSGYGHRQIPL